MVLAQLRPISQNVDKADTHIVFVHGLSGHIEKTWTSNASHSPVLWPTWLSEDIPGTGIWLLGYKAAISKWLGSGVNLSHRSENLLPLLLAEPRLGNGNIIFVAHSFGGLIVKQILRNAERNSQSNVTCKDFLTRVRAVAFLGTPQRGSKIADLMRSFQFLSKPTEATQSLSTTNHQLEDLNNWYRKFNHNGRTKNLILIETIPEELQVFGWTIQLGTVVSSHSADIGLQDLPIPVDECHRGLSKPADRNAEVYIHIRKFIYEIFSVTPPVIQTNEEIREVTKVVKELVDQTRKQGEQFSDLKNALEIGVIKHGTSSSFIDVEVAKRLDHLRKCRMFSGFNVAEQSRRLVAALTKGDLKSASDKEKGDALAWCARLLAVQDSDEAEAVLTCIPSPKGDLYRIAKGVVLASQDELSLSLKHLCEVGTPAAYGAAYLCVFRAKGFEEATLWLNSAQLGVSDLDSDAKLFYITRSLEAGEWEAAFDVARALTDADFDRSPGLNLVAADAYLMRAVPDEFRMDILQYLPLGAARFSLRSDPSTNSNRRTATRLYERMHAIAWHFDMPVIATFAGDKALWLRLMDPETRERARKDLVESINDPLTFLRRLGLAMQFNIEIDLERAEKEVDRQTALSGGMSREASIARLILALRKENLAEGAAYIVKHQEQLLRHLSWKVVYSCEIEMLARSGQLTHANERLQEAIDKGLTDLETTRLRSVLAEATGGDPIAERLSAYKESNSLIDLQVLVNAFEVSKDWLNVCEYGGVLLQRTGDVDDAHRYVVSLYKVQRLEDVLKTFRMYPTLLAHDPDLPLLRAQTLFELGNLSEAQQELGEVRRFHDSPNSRQLHINLAIVSGDWESLQSFVEEEWNSRSDRTAKDILRAGQIAQQIGAARAKELICGAAECAPNDPEVLIGCYIAATAAGWEDAADVHQWLVSADECSEGNGPIQRVSIEEILKGQPEWQKQEIEAWEKLAKGDIPVYLAGRLLNRSMLSLYLMPAIVNLDERDVRMRSLIFSFSGSREQQTLNPRIIAMEATALITSEFLDLLGIFIETFDKIVVPHNTLGWLMEEKARILYHQPSLVKAANELKSLVSNGHLEKFEATTTPPEKLVSEVGETLASFITEASKSEQSDSPQRLVVRGGPIYGVNAATRLEEVDVTEFESNLCSCGDVVEKLAQKGILTAKETTDARATLDIWEKSSRNIPNVHVPDNAVLYLDDVSVSQLQSQGLLSKIHHAEISAVVSQSTLDRANALIAYDKKGLNAVSIVDKLCHRLRDGLSSGKVKLGKAFRTVESGREPTMPHPTIAMLQLIDEVEAGVVDDRFINQLQSIENDGTTCPLMTTLDLLRVLIDQGKISDAQILEAHTKLRLANFCLVPVTAEELSRYMENSTISNGVLEETAELRAIRENIQSVRMKSILQSPKELSWLDGVTQACLQTLKEQWKQELDATTSAVRSSWLIELCDVRGWAQSRNESVEHFVERYRNWLTLFLLFPASLSKQAKNAYWSWFESRLLAQIAEEDPATYQYLVDWAKEFIEESVKTCIQELESNNE